MLRDRSKGNKAIPFSSQMPNGKQSLNLICLSSWSWNGFC